MRMTIVDLRDEPNGTCDQLECQQCGCTFDGDERVVERGSGLYCGQRCAEAASRRQATRLVFVGVGDVGVACSTELNRRMAR
jgi:hypothetical protein